MGIFGLFMFMSLNAYVYVHFHAQFNSDYLMEKI